MRPLLSVAAAMRPAAWFCLALLAYLSLVPREGIDAVRSGAHELGFPSADHALGYGATMLVLALAYGARHGILALGTFLTGYGILLELAQSLAPGRTPQVIDAVENFIGVVAGTVFLAIGRGIAQRLRRSAPAASATGTS
jgi:VanZ family protein